MAAMKVQGGRMVPTAQLQKPAGYTDAEWNQLTDTGKRKASQGAMAPSPGGRFRDHMFNAGQIDEVVEGLQSLAPRFPKVRQALQAAMRARQAWDEARRLIDQSVIWD